MFPTNDYRCIYLLATWLYDMTNRWGSGYLRVLYKGDSETTVRMEVLLVGLASLRELPESVSS